MQFQIDLFNATMLGMTFLYSLILLINSILRKNKTMMAIPFIFVCSIITLLQLTVILEWLWMPGTYPRPLFLFLFVMEYLLTFLAEALSYWYAQTYIYAISHPETHKRLANEKTYLKTIFSLAVLAAVLFASSLGNGWLYRIDEDGMTTFTAAYLLVFLFCAVWPVLTLISLFRNRKKLHFSLFLLLVSYVTIPSVFFISDYFTGMSLGCALIAIMFFLIYTRLGNAQGERLMEQKALVLKREAEMAETKMELMMSQIQPHFLYNALSSIAYLCTENPVEAEKATNEFSNYLKGNLQFIGAKSPILFEIELKHTEQYLKIEQRRFFDRLNVVYDIRERNFRIPALTLQTLVENAVRYSVNSRYEPTTVTIVSDHTPTEYIVKIIDDGPGFDTTVQPSNDRRHIGLSGARYRLKEMSGGYLEIDSVIGKGTTITIHIPKEVQP